MTNSFQSATEQRRADLARISDQGTQIHRVSGRFLVTGHGEVAYDVDFPVLFGTRPAPSFGGELEENQVATTGSFPTISVVVLRWNREERMPGQFLYKGATLGVVVGGTSGPIWVHWHMDGPAFRNPVRNTGTLEETI